MRPVIKDPLIDAKEYKDYGDSRSDLIKNLGQYCSYCEMRVEDMALAVEHIQPKSEAPKLEKKGSNFLLCCPYCNLVKTSRHKVIVAKQSVMDILDAPKKDKPDQVTEKIIYRNTSEYCFWPHRDNTFRAFQYDDEGLVRVHPSLTLENKVRAAATIMFTFLDGLPIEESYKRSKFVRFVYLFKGTGVEKANKESGENRLALPRTRFYETMKDLDTSLETNLPKLSNDIAPVLGTDIYQKKTKTKETDDHDVPKGSDYATLDELHEDLIGTITIGNEIYMPATDRRWMNRRSACKTAVEKCLLATAGGFD